MGRYLRNAQLSPLEEVRPTHRPKGSATDIVDRLRAKGDVLSMEAANVIVILRQEKQMAGERLARSRLR